MIKENDRQTGGKDACLIAICNQATELFTRLRAYNTMEIVSPGYEIVWQETHDPCWKLIEKALAITPQTVPGAAALLRLLADHWRVNDVAPDHKLFGLAAVDNIVHLLETI